MRERARAEVIDRVVIEHSGEIAVSTHELQLTRRRDKWAGRITLRMNGRHDACDDACDERGSCERSEE